MHKFWKSCIVGACVALSWSSAVSTAQAAPYSELVVFGDSLSDPGNASALSLGNFPPSPPYAGTFSNGPTAAQYLAQKMGVTVQLGWPTATAGSNNFAVGGATTGTLNYNVEADSPTGLGAAFPALKLTGVTSQIQRYASQHPTVPNPTGTLFMVWAGPNDLFLGAAQNADPNNYIGAAIASMQANLLSLVGMGAKHILVPNMPDLGATPEALAGGPAKIAGLSALSAGFNGGLALLLGGLTPSLATMGVELIAFDTAAVVAQLLAAPQAQGFTNGQGACIANAAALPTCDGYVFFDGVHPTTAAHQVLAQRFGAAVGVPTPGSLSLLLAALMAMVWVRRQAVRTH